MGIFVGGQKHMLLGSLRLFHNHKCPIRCYNYSQKQIRGYLIYMQDFHPPVMHQ